MCLSGDEVGRTKLERLYRNSAACSGIVASGFTCLLWMVKAPEGVILDTVWLDS